jgi:hypothetical protein
MTRFFSIAFCFLFLGLESFAQESNVSEDDTSVVKVPVDDTVYNRINYGSSSSSPKDLIHPNPTTGIFYLSSVVDGDNIQIFDGTGRVVYEIRGNESRMKIDATHLESGIYRVIVRDENKRLKINQKVMIN